MERIQSTEVGRPTLLIDVTPKELKELIARIEVAASRAIPGSSIVTPLSKTVSLHYKVRNEHTFVGSTYRDSEVVAERLQEVQ